jgi:hypothetical protein
MEEIFVLIATSLRQFVIFGKYERLIISYYYLNTCTGFPDV